MEKKIQIKVMISGRVQGVFYRAETKMAADRMGVKGYVKNLPTGSVEAVFEGDRHAVAQMLAWCHKGPPLSKVQSVQERETETLSNFETFDIKY